MKKGIKKILFLSITFLFLFSFSLNVNASVIENNNIVVIVLLLVIIAILATLCVLFATDTLTFNKKDDKKDNTIINDEKLSEEKEN